MAEVEHANKRAMAALVFEGFLTRFGFGIVAFALPLYAYSLGMSIVAIGLLMSVNLGVSAATKPVLAGVVDRIGYRRAAVIATIMRAAVLPLLLVASTPLALFGIQVLRGMAKGFRDPALHVLVASHGGKRSLASAFAWYGTAKSVAASLGKAVAGAMLGLWTGLYDITFALALIPALVPVFLLLHLVEEVKVVRPAAEKRSGTSLGATMRIARDLGPVIGFGFAVSATGRMLHGLLPILAVEYAGLNEAIAGSLYLVSATVMLFSGPAFGWLSDNFSRRLVMAVRGVANAASSVLYVAMPTAAGFYLAKAVDSLGAAAFKPAWGALMAEAALLRSDHQGRVMAVMGAGRDAGTLVGPIVGGALWSLFGPIPMLLTRAVLAVGTEVYGHIVLRRQADSLGHPEPEEDQRPSPKTGNVALLQK